MLFTMKPRAHARTDYLHKKYSFNESYRNSFIIEVLYTFLGTLFIQSISS